MLSRQLRWRLVPTLAACTAAGLAVLIAAAFWAVPHVADQLRELADKLQQAYRALRESATATGSTTPIEKFFRDFSSVGQQLQSLVSRAAGFLASAFGAAGALLFVVFVALYTAMGAGVYRRGLLHLVPLARRPRASQVLGQLASTLRR